PEAPTPIVARDDVDAIVVGGDGGRRQDGIGAGDDLGVPGGGAVDRPVEVQAVAGSLGGDVHAVAAGVRRYRRRGERGPGAGHHFGSPVRGAVDRPVEVQAIAGPFGGDDRAVAVLGDGGRRVGRPDRGDGLGVPAA